MRDDRDEAQGIQITPLSTQHDLQDPLAELHASLMRMLTQLPPDRPQEAGAANLEKLRESLWAATQELDSALDDLRMPRELDLGKEDPTTARRLHDFLVWRYFSPHPVGDPGEIHYPGFTPEEGELKVFYLYGRWFCAWLKLDEDMSRPENDTREFLVIYKEEDGRIVFGEV
jgi:hypothetical protein